MPLRLVRAGILAANAHNAQVWRFAVTPRRIEVHDDTSRGLGAVDPYRWEVHLSAGCAIENIVLAAAAARFVPTVTLAPTGRPTLLATVDLTPGTGTVSPLYQAIPRRTPTAVPTSPTAACTQQSPPAWTPWPPSPTSACTGC